MDDEQPAMDALANHLKGFPQVHVRDTLTDPEMAVDRIVQLKPHLLFMDVVMPGITGFEVVARVYQNGVRPDVIFVTAFDQYAIRAIRYAAFDYLLKPVNFIELQDAMKRLMEKANETDKEDRLKLLIEKTSRRKIKLTSSGGFILIKPEDILYIQADWNYSEVFFDREKREMVTMNIGALEGILPREDFFRISRSQIINLGYLTRVSRRKLEATLIKDGKEYTFKIPLLRIRNLERFLTLHG
ncbi:MAG: response regulator transcription factor [Bacteroidales bacterium]|nr:response regulator transcription factor [Bacteroidales bacterium]